MLPGTLPGSFCICVPDKFDRKVCYLKKRQYLCVGGEDSDNSLIRDSF